MPEVSAHGKYILAGEHAVLRGSAAIVFPLPDIAIQLRFERGADALHITSSGVQPDIVTAAFNGLLHYALPILGKVHAGLHLDITIDNQIPIGKGLGFSAALCVVFSRMCVCLNWIDVDSVYHYAKQFEDYFHGASSGVDVRAALSHYGIHVLPSSHVSLVHPVWQPPLYLVDSGVIGSTAKAVSRVQGLQSESWAQRVDHNMRLCVHQVLHALEQYEGGMQRLSAAMKQAQDCFDQWGLTPRSLEVDIRNLYKAGAHAVKFTGAGGGGFFLVLWPGMPLDRFQPGSVIEVRLPVDGK